MKDIFWKRKIELFTELFYLQDVRNQSEDWKIKLKKVIRELEYYDNKNINKIIGHIKYEYKNYYWKELF